MTNTTSGGAPEIGDQVDESGLTPSTKAHIPPLQGPDEVRVRLEIQPDGLSVDGGARVYRSLFSSVNFAVVCLMALTGVVITVLLCHLQQAGGWATLGIAVVAFVVIMAIGLACTRSGQVRKTNPPW